jgi:hypothetical protein
LPGGKGGRGEVLTIDPYLATSLKKEYSHNYTPDLDFHDLF